MDASSDDPRPPSHDRGVRPASSRRDEAGPAADPGTPPWLELPDDCAGRRRGWILAGAVLPWVLLAALIVRAPGPADDATLSTDIRPSPTATAATVGPEVRETPGADSSGGRTELGLADVAAAAIPVLRAWIGRADELSIEGIDARGYGVLEHAVVEAIDHPGQGAAVASVLAVVASFDDGTRQVLRVAVPLIVLNREVRPAGDPWLLPPPTLSVAAVRSTPLAGADSALIDAVGLQLAELYGEVAEIHGLHVGELWPLVVDATIRDPLDGKLRRQQIWLRADGQRLPIAGWFAVPPGRAGSDPGASDTAAPRAEEDGDPDMATDEPAPS